MFFQVLGTKHVTFPGLTSTAPVEVPWGQLARQLAPNMGISINGGIQTCSFLMENPIKMDDLGGDLGVPPFMEAPNISQ